LGTNQLKIQNSKFKIIERLRTKDLGLGTGEEFLYLLRLELAKSDRHNQNTMNITGCWRQV
jgi:hypothetical protein